MTNLVPTGRIFREYREVPAAPVIKREIKPATPGMMYCSVFLFAVVLGAIGGANFVANHKNPNKYNFIAGIAFCSASGITLLALAIIAARCPIKENPPERV